MKQHASTGLLDPHAVLNSIPNDWTLQDEGYDLVEFLSSLLDSKMT